MLNKKRSLLLRAHPEHGCRSDLLQIRNEIGRLVPDASVKVITGKLNLLDRMCFRGVPLVSFVPWKGKAPFGSEVFSGVGLSKEAECVRLQAHGVPVPRFHVWREGEPQPDLSDFGAYVVRKPNLGARGARVEIVRSDRIKWKRLRVEYASLESDPFYQEFVYTGARPVSYRVGSLFSEPVYAVKIEGAGKSTAETDDRSAAGAYRSGASIVANSRRSRYSLCKDAEILELAARAHDAFPGIPLLGVDIIKDADTGKLWVIEVNASGYVWHFSSPVGRAVQEANDLDFASSFGGLRRAGEILARRFFA